MRNSVLTFIAILLFLAVTLAQAGTATFSTAGTTSWTAPAGVTSVKVEAWGGGGAGGGNPTNTDGAGGGGGGAYSRTIAIPVVPGTVYTVTVGAGGIGGTGVGGSGGDSWFSTAATILAKGGTGGQDPVGGAGGVAGVGGAAAAGIGTTKFSGGNGGTGRNNNTGRGGPGGSSAGTATAGTSGPVVWATATAAAPPAGGGIGGDGGNANREDGFAPVSGNGGGGGGGAERSTLGGNGVGGKVVINYGPTVSSINRAAANPTNAASVSWTVTFSEAVVNVVAARFSLVNTGLGGTPAITGVTGSGTTWTVTASTGTGSGTLGLNLTSIGTIADTAGNLLTGTIPVTGQVYTIDRIAPTVSSINRVDPSPTTLTSVSWTVTFSKSVTGVDSADFALAQGGGMSGAIISLVTGSGITWTVTASTGGSTGTLGLNLVDNDSIIDGASNPLGGAGAGNGNFTGQVYTINPPNCTSAAAGPANWNLPATWINCRGGVPLAGDTVTIASGHTVTQNINSPAISTLTISGTLNNATNTLTVNGNVVINTGGIYSGGSGAASITGNFSNSGTFTSGSGTWTFNGTLAQGITGATAFQRLTLNNASGLALSNNVTVSSLLTLTSGNVTTGANILSTSANCSASIARTSGFVAGNLRLTFPAGTTTCTYHVGSGTTYAPIGVTMVASTGGTLTGTTTGNEHPLIASSGIDANMDVNRYWTLWSSGDTVVATSYSPTFNFIAGDVDAIATPTNFVIGKYASGAWTLPTPVTAGATSTGVSNVAGPINSATDFAAGEVVFVCTVPAGSPVGTTCVCDNFGRAALNPSTIYGGNWSVSASDATGILPSIVNSGYLRLTNNTGNNAKAATVPGTFPAAGNWVTVEFKHYAYNGTGADGIALTLSDSAITPTPGAFGGSLGYAQKSNPGSDCTTPGGCPGFNGGWVGIGIDEYGNFSNPTEGRIGGPGRVLDSVSVRGSGSGQIGYPYLGGTATLAPGIDNAASPTAAYGHAYRLTVDARGYTWDGATGTKSTLVQVERDTTGTGTSYTPVVPSFDAYVVNASQADVPVNWKLSFTGSTGGATNIHEIAGLKICAQTYVPPAGYSIQVDNLTPTTCPTDPRPTVTVKPLNANGQVVTTYTNTVTLSATLLGGGAPAGTVTWAKITGGGAFTPAGASATYTYVAGDAGVASFSLDTNTQQNLYITVTETPGTLSSTFGSAVQFSSGVASFVINSAADTLGTGVVAGRTHLMSITRNASVCGGGTDASYTGSKMLDGWYAPAGADHPTGALAPQICATSGGTCLPTTGACQTLSIAPPSIDPNSNNMPALTFTAGVASFCLATSDVGKYSINLRDDSVATGTPDVTGSTSNLTVRPFAVVVSDVKQGATNNPANGTSGPGVFAKAGTAFQATVAGYLWNSAGDTGNNGLPGAAANWSAITAAGIAPSYADSVTLAASAPFAPAAGTLSNGSVMVTSGSTTATTLSYAEVGSFTLTATAATSYLNTAGVDLGNRVAIFSNPASASRNGLVGRFIPDHFALAGMPIVNRILSGCAPASSFTYAGEELQAIFILEAQNAAGIPTANYLTANGYAKLNGTVPANFNFGAIDLADAVPPLTATPSMGLTPGNSSGSWTAGGQGTFNVNLTVNRATTPDGPFESFNLGVDPIDTDGVRLASYNLDVNNDATNDHGLVGTSKIRFGQLKLSNAHGSELLDLPIPIQTQYWNGTSFVTNTADNCTTLTSVNIGLTSYTGNLNSGETSVSPATISFANGTSSLKLTKPGTGNNGSVDFCVDLDADPGVGTLCSATLANLPYLQGLWPPGTSYNNDPGGRATFGVYNKRNEFIYLREAY